MINSGIYSINDKKNGRTYFGSSIDVYKRWQRHRNELRRGIHCNKFLQRSWNLFGENNFEFGFIEVVPDKTQLRKREQAWLDVMKNDLIQYGHDYRKVLFNNVMQVDFDLFKRKSVEYTEARKKAASDRMKGNKYRVGHKSIWNEESRKKVSEKLKGTRHSEESYIKQAEKMKGRKTTPEATQKRLISYRKTMSNKIQKPAKIGPGKPKGERHYKVKLTAANVIEIRKLKKSGVIYPELMKLFNVSQSALCSIVTGRSWKSIPMLENNIISQ